MTEEVTEAIAPVEWLDEAYIQRILTYHEGQEINIVKYEKEAATKKGENFASSLARIQVQYITESTDQLKSLAGIVKSRLEDEILSEIESEFNIFDRESQMYKCILKSCEDLLRNIGDDTQFGPRAIYVDNRVIVLEDLKVQGYTMMEVRKGLDMEHCSLVLEKLAKLHASTKVLFDKQPELFKYHIVANMSETRTPLHDIFENAMSTSIKYVTAKEDLSQYADKLTVFGKDIIKKIIGVFSRDPNGFNVLNHGDMWVNNFMFKKDTEGNVLDVLLVDYQEGYFGSPGIDFNYFIYTSWNDSVYQNHRDDLINLYFSVLQSTLMKLKAKSIPSLDTIYHEIRSKGDHGVATACCMFPILATSRRDLADPAILIVNDDKAQDKRFKLFDSDNFHNKLKLVLPDFIKENIL